MVKVEYLLHSSLLFVSRILYNPQTSAEVLHGAINQTNKSEDEWAIMI